MATVPVERERFDVVSKIALDRTCAELLDQIAAAHCDGNRSAAIRHLIRVHAGLEAEKAREEQKVEVEPWKYRRLSRDLVAEIAALIRGGAAKSTALKITGVSVTQAQSWSKQGRAAVRAHEASLYADWVMTLDRAEGELEYERVKGVDDPKWLLERTAAETYGKRTVSDATITHRSLPMIDLERLTVEEARLFLTLARKASPQSDDPGISARARPIGELLPADIDGEAVEVD